MRPRFNLYVLSVLLASLAAPVAWMAARQPDPLPHETSLKNGLPSLVVASLNLAMATDLDTIAREMAATRGLRDADVVFVQEVKRDEPGKPSVAEGLAERLGRQATFASPDGSRTFSGIATVSRYPLRDLSVRELPRHNLVFRSRIRLAVAATVDTPIGPVRVINTHLDTRINPAQRLRELEPALEEASRFHGPSVIGGDFNTNDMQWVSNVVPVPFPGWQAQRVRELMKSRGFDTPFQTRRATFDHLGMQLDWLFTNSLQAVAWGIEPVEFSDHHAIWAQFARR